MFSSTPFPAFCRCAGFCATSVPDFVPLFVASEKSSSLTVKVLQENGCEVWIPKTQGCCAALHHHAGLDNEAKKFAAANCVAFAEGLTDGPNKLDAIVNNTGGCGPVLKEYGHLLQGTPFEKQGEAFGSRVKDIHEFLMELGPVAPTHEVPLKATCHDACGLSHAQKIRTPPKATSRDDQRP